MKKLTLVMVVLLAVTLFATACTPTPTPGGVVEGNKGGKVYLITMDQMDQHWVNVDAGAKKAAEELGIEYKWFAPEKKEDAKQIEFINNAVVDKADVILIAANGPAVVDALQAASDAGVKIIYVDSPTDFKALQTLATDNQAAGKTAGEQMLNELTAKGVTEGKLGIIGVRPDTDSCIKRENGFREAFAGTKFEILETQFGEGDTAKSQEFAAAFITQGVVGIFGVNEGSTVGTGNAIKESGAAVVGVGFDKSDAIMEHINNGYILCAMSQNPDQMGYKGMYSAADAIAGKTLSPEFLDTGVSVLEKEGGDELAVSGKVYLITMDQMDQHWVNVDAGAKKAAEELGLEYKWFAPEKKEDAKQIEFINNAVVDKADVILIAANGPAVVDALKAASDAGVKVIYVDSPTDFKALQTLATDNQAAGKTAGEQMLNELTAKGVTEGKIGIIGVRPDTDSCIKRENGFREAFAGTKFEILETQFGEGDTAKSQEMAAAFITQKVVGIFGVNEGSTVGTGNAIKESGAAVIGVGFDKSDAILEHIKNGYILCAMSQNPDQMGYKGVYSAAKAILGETLSPDFLDTGVSILNKSSI